MEVVSQLSTDGVEVRVEIVDLSVHENLKTKLASKGQKALYLLGVQLFDGGSQSFDFLNLFGSSSSSGSQLLLDVDQESVVTIISRNQAVLGKILEVGNNVVNLTGEILVSGLLEMELHANEDFEESVTGEARKLKRRLKITEIKWCAPFA